MILSHAQLSDWYLQLARQLEAGLGVSQSLKIMRTPSKAKREAMINALEEGYSIGEVFTALATWLPRADRQFIAAASRTSRMPQTLHNLSSYHEQLNKAKGKVLLASAYPVGVIHFMVLTTTLTAVVQKHGLNFSLTEYALSVLSIFVPLWFGIGWLVYLSRTDSRIPTILLGFFPIIRGFQKARQRSQLAFVLGNMLEAGAGIRESWELAGDVSKSGYIRRLSRRVVAMIDSGNPPSLVLAKCSLPEDFIALYQTGESTGELPEMLMRLANNYQEKAANRLKLATVAYPFFLFMAVAAIVGYITISYYIGYTKELNSIMDSM